MMASRLDEDQAGSGFLSKKKENPDRAALATSVPRLHPDRNSLAST
jgi:hypothetical protein